MAVVSAFVLAGGRSSRMGTDKALLRFGDENLLQIALRKATAMCPAPVIVGDRGRYGAYGTVIEDRFPGCGPLGGIHAALAATQSDLNVILSVDTPLMTSEFLVWLVGRAREGSDLAVVPQSGDRSQPLSAVYRRAALPVIEHALRLGDFKVDRIFSQIPTRFVLESELRSAGFGPEMFCNLNTPDEYETAVREAAQVALQARQG